VQWALSVAVVPAAVTDRRAALKVRHRAAIVAAAAGLIEETGGLRFTIDDLARRADVSRRTVFNHFASVDDIVTEVFSDVIGVVVETYRRVPAVGDDRSAMFAELALAVRTTDLVTPMAYFTRSLRSQDERSPAVAAVLVRVLTELSERLSTAMVDRHPRADVVDVHLLVTTIVGNLLVIYRHWDLATGAADDAASRRAWADLVDRLLDNARDGYGSAPHIP
jgi:TetR/AcrR family transcriptional regulator of autoinduction and epiphytic fitness